MTTPIGNGPAAVIVERGCGFRVCGGIYGETGLTSEGGLPLEHFVMDPPVAIDPDALGLSDIGVKLIQRPGSDVWDVWDIVGQQHYPSPADYLEEVRRFGLSRRFPSTLEFDKLGKESRIILVHRRGSVERAHDYYWDGTGKASGYRFGGCPKELDAHRFDHATPEMTDEAFEKLIAWVHGESKEMPWPCCAGVWWDDLDDGVPVGNDPRLVTRKMPSFEYLGRLTPEGVEPTYRPAVIARFPLTRLVVVNDPEGGAHEKGMEKLSKAGHSPTLVDE